MTGLDYLLLFPWLACRPSAIFSIILRLKARMSSGFRLVTKPRSLATDLSLH
jgi:hypothetical protein